MSTKLEKLLAQVAEEKARIKAEEKAKEQKQIADVSRLVVTSGIAGLPHDFLAKSFAEIAAAHAKNGGSDE